MSIKIKMILAMAENGAIGHNNELPWGRQYPQDLKYFQSQTLEQTIVYGRATYVSFKRPTGLPKRNNVVITTNPHLINKSVTALTIEDFDKALAQCQVNETSESLGEVVWIIGGKSMYERYLHLVDELHITRIPGEFIADTLMDSDFGLGETWIDHKVETLEGGLTVDVYSR